MYVQKGDMNPIHKLNLIHCIIINCTCTCVCMYICKMFGAVFIIMLLRCVCEESICKREDKHDCMIIK